MSAEQLSLALDTEDAPAVQEAIHTCLHCEAGYISEHRLRTTDGKYIWVTDRGQVVQRSPEGTALRMVGSIRNIDDRKRYEAEIQKLAFYDTLTELPNRRLLIDRLHKAIQRNQRRGEMGAVRFLDMDRFKHLNDTHGHAIGDALLTQVASRLRHCVRAQDTVARLGGDEFVVLLDSLSTTRDGAQVNAHAVADKILQALNEPYRLSADLSYSSTPSIGVTVFGGTNDSVDSILCRADEAMYKAKCAGRNNIKMSA